jgi:hypothetical protein
MACMICGSLWHVDSECPKNNDGCPDESPLLNVEHPPITVSSLPSAASISQLVAMGVCPDCGSPTHQGPCR